LTLTSKPLSERSFRILGGVVALICLLDFVALAGWNNAHRDNSSWRARNPYTTQFTGMPELEKFVEHARGLRFKQPVAVELVDQQELNAARHKEAELSGLAGRLVPTRRSDDGAVLNVMGLLPKAIDVEQAVGDAEDAGVVGVYFPRQKRLLVSGHDQTPFVREVLVHELTHALDDQYFDLGRADIGLHNDEALQSWTALAEGDATSVEKQYLESLPAAERQQAEQERNGIASAGGTPSAIDDLLSYPYIGGLHFVDELRRTGGNKALNAAFRNPPTTSEQILRPDHFLSHDVPALVTKPTPQGPAVGRGVFGVLNLGLLLSTSLDGPALRSALDGWDGDHFVAWTEPAGGTCLAVNVANDSPAAAAKLADAFHQWLDHNPAGTVAVNGDTVTMQRCA
jgi:hypothetical protein